MRAKTPKVRAINLNAMCTDANVCLTFGKEDTRLKKHFGGFTDFRWLQPDIHRIGSVSVNGFINELTYEREGYKANAVLKSSIEEDSDNLLYEFLIGRRFVNKFTKKRFPCFLETYGFFTYKKISAWEKLQNKSNTIDNMNEYIEQVTNFTPHIYRKSCVHSKYICVLVEHMNNIKSLQEYLRYNIPFFNLNLLKILYQVYMPLATMADKFTHYDLHTGNIQIYRPFKDKYVTYHYHVADSKIITFDCIFLVKIIDYGRCFVDKLSKNIYDVICNTTDCSPDCGYDFGYSNLQLNRAGDLKYVTSQVKNESHDLRALEILKTDFIRLTNISDNLERIVNNVVYLDTYGTPENTELGYVKDAHEFTINNVTDAYRALEDLLQMEGEQETVTIDNYTKAGDLHIYLDRDMEYIPEGEPTVSPNLSKN
jgi:hypothetical protein